MKYKEQKGTIQASSEPRENGRVCISTELPTPPPETLGFIDSSKFEVVDPETGEIAQQGKLSQQDAINEARNIRFNLQDAAKNILYSYYGSLENVPVNKKGYQVHHRTCTCSRFRLGATTQIVKSKTNNKAFFAGLMNCANSRTCTVCSAKISERKANEMRTAFNIARAEKLGISLLTFTAPHNSGDKLEDLKKGISKALELFWTGATATRFKAKYGIIGHIRSFEVRHGSKGWHPHFHIIIFSELGKITQVKKKTKTKPARFRKCSSTLPNTDRDSRGNILLTQTDEWLLILDRWKSCCKRAGLNAPNLYGMDIQNGAHAGEYISKFGSDDEILKTKSGKTITWDMADEMTKGNTKTGRKGSSSPWDLLADSVDGETKEIRQENKKLFLFYARAMERVNLIRWSKGLRAYFDLGAQDTDEEILQQEEDKADLLCNIEPHEWEFIIKNKYRALVLQLAETKAVFDDDGIQIDGGHVAIARLLYRNDFESFEEFLYSFKERDHLIDYTDLLTNEFETTENKTGKDLSKINIKPEYKNHLTTTTRPIFQAIADRNIPKMLADEDIEKILKGY